MQIPILNGIYTDSASDFRTSYPRNLVPVPKDNGIASGYLRPAEGIVQFGVGTGIDRGGINWNSLCYRVMGDKLILVDYLGNYTELGTIPGIEQVTMTYSYDKLAIAADNKLYYWQAGVLSQVTDPDLGGVNTVLWVDGYFMTTDGTSLVVTELNDPFSVDPLKYGSSEVDPDPVKCLLKLRNEVYALNRYTIEVFHNIGGSGFPFQRVEGAAMQRGTFGAKTSAVFIENIAFLGSGRKEAPAVWLGSNGTTLKISTREIDQILLEYSESILSAAILETRLTNNQQLLYIHFTDKTLVYDASASADTKTPVWYILTSSIVGDSAYRAFNFVWCYDKWLCGDRESSSHGYLTNTVATHYGNTIGWEFSTSIVYNNSKGALFNELELVCLTGRTTLGTNPTIWTSYSVDGETWSQEKPRTLGLVGDRLKRITWLQQGHMRNWRCQKFRGNSDALLSIARLEASVEPLNV